MCIIGAGFSKGAGRMAILITGARVIDPASHTDAPLAILIEDGRITRMAPMGATSPTRIQGAFISEEDVEKIANKTIEQQKAVYDENFMKLDEVGSKTSIDKDDVDNDDPLYNDIVEFVISTRKASASLLQRRFKLGYNRAARIIDLLEERGIIGPANGSKPREVLVDNDDEEDEE